MAKVNDFYLGATKVTPKATPKPEIIAPASAPKVTRTTAAQDAAELVDLKKQIAEIATQTGQKVDPNTGGIIIDATATATKFGVSTEPGKFPKAGTLLRYQRGSNSNTQIPIYANGSGGEYEGPEQVNPLIPGSTGNTTESERTLAKDTFANTLALLMGKSEAAQPWVNEIYQLASGFYKSGSSIADALNLSLYDAKSKGLAPQFTKRFDAVFKLQERLQKGEALSVPTIAEFIKSESDTGDILREAGLGELATQDYIGSILGTGKSVLAIGNIISDVFTTIDTAPKALRDTLNTYFPNVDRTSLAKALLTGAEGAAALKKKVEGISVMSAAGSQGITVDLATAGDIAARGFNYSDSLTGFGTVKDLQRVDELARFSGESFTQTEAIGATFNKDKTALDKAEREKMKELARYSASPGLAPSALRGQNARSMI